MENRKKGICKHYEISIYLCNPVDPVPLNHSQQEVPWNKYCFREQQMGNSNFFTLMRLDAHKNNIHSKEFSVGRVNNKPIPTPSSSRNTYRARSFALLKQFTCLTRWNKSNLLQVRISYMYYNVNHSSNLTLLLQ